MADWAFITPRLAVGAGPTRPEHLETLTEMLVSHILDLRELERYPQKLAAARGGRVRWAWNPAFDDDQPKPVAWFHRSLVFGWRTLMVPRQKLLVCCTSGVDRSPLTCYALLRSMGWQVAAAADAILAARPQAAPLETSTADAAINELGYV